MGYPVHVQIDYVERHSRLTTFFRILLLIPHLFVLAVLQFVAWILVVVAWFAILFTGRYPRGMFGVVTGVLNYSTRVNCYALLLTDRFPPFGLGARDDGYPVQVWADPPERLSRLTTFFRILLIVPAAIVLYVLLLIGRFMAFLAWWVILVVGRLPRGLFEVMELPQRYQARVGAYGSLITDAYPWFQAETEPDPEPWQAPA